ncbi:Glycosyltransferase involved in cell wall bisynthesis [Franzmannia pantelleriensis]|uniref:Glycosyltransferase involved in cell wall bisynthesis n=1 Tax=Franzmannia pantelleriensis TaxID=48727 RepID=A0A1G9G7I8_9GAMM|nr:glycosyltransferase family 4 protein [Halomonas pantelleriensis]SDK96738.1 Glycosyltransferase involved in cell wall bisynthesis [Halomonas pantelleriensis]
MTATPDLCLIVAGDPGQLTGGYVYDAHIVEALEKRGWWVQVVGLAGRFPDPDERAKDALETALAAQPDDARVVIDGLAMGGLPEVLEAHASRLDLTALVHHPLADETGLDEATRVRLFDSEARALALVARVISTSAFTARRLRDFGVAVSQVVEPGVEPAALAPSALDLEDSERPQRLLCVASVTPRKGHDLLVEALAGLDAARWTCDCIGGLDRDPEHAERVAASVVGHGLTEQFRLLGERDPQALDTAYREADLFVLPSHYEGYGMVVTEALARGLPVITTTGGALRFTLPQGAGLAVAPGDVGALRGVLRRWLEDAGLRRELRRGAIAAREQQRDWQAAGDAFAAALGVPHT